MNRKAEPSKSRHARLVHAAAATAAICVNAAAPARAAEPVPAHTSGISPYARVGATAYFGDRIAGEPAGDVFPAGPSLELGLGWIVARSVSITMAWERFFSGVGEGSPYARLPARDGYQDRWVAGLRALVPPDRAAAFVVGLALGFSQFHQWAEDDLGNHADASLRGFTAHTEMGLALRPTPFLAFDLVGRFVVANLAGHTGEVTVANVPRETSSDNSMWVVGLDPGVRVAAEFGFR